MFRKPTFNSLYDPFGSPRRGQKPSLPLKKESFLPLRLSCKESSTFSPSPSSSGSGDVAGSAIAPPEFWYRQRSLCPQGAADEFLRNSVAIICRLALHKDSINLPLSRKRFLKPCIILSAHS